MGQFLITAPTAEMDGVKEEFDKLSPGLSLIYSTSPMGDDSLWLEIFPPGVSKSSAARWLAEKLSIGAHETVAMGNDFNDLDLLAWAGSAYLTSDASPALRPLYPALPASTESPLAHLVRILSGKPA
jgi:hydroxymethylpyrimidine pyrophosphatase-like HAD family hydrolase